MALERRLGHSALAKRTQTEERRVDDHVIFTAFVPPSLPTLLPPPTRTHPDAAPLSVPVTSSIVHSCMRIASR